MGLGSLITFFRDYLMNISLCKNFYQEHINRMEHMDSAVKNWHYQGRHFTNQESMDSRGVLRETIADCGLFLEL